MKEELDFVKFLESSGMKIPNVSILHCTSTEHKNFDAYGNHRCMRCSRSLCNKIVLNKDSADGFLCHQCCKEIESKKAIPSKRIPGGNALFEFDLHA